MIDPTTKLDQLEANVLARIQRHRQEQRDDGSLGAGAVVTLAALAFGMLAGALAARDSRSPAGSESVVLADDARRAPSALLAANP